MKLKYFWMLAAAVVLGFTACSDDEEEAAVGLTAGSITPAGSSVTYQLKSAVEGMMDNKDDSVAWDVTDAALAEALLKVTPTLDATVSYNGTEITSEGVVVNANSPITVVVTNGKKTVNYTVNVYRAQTAAEGIIKKATLSATNVVWRDYTYWKGKFWTYVVTNTITNAETGDAKEVYLLMNSTDGVTWTDVDYKVTNVENEVIGGEGARLLVYNDKLYLLTGQRTLGTDKFGNAAEVEDGWFGPSPFIAKWRVFVSDDGENFSSLEDGAQVLIEGEPTANILAYNAPFVNVFTLNGSMFMQGGYTYGFGMQQMGRNIISSKDGKTWTRISPVDGDGANFAVPNDAAYFMLGNKLYLVGGYRNYIDLSFINSTVYTTTDGTTWTIAADMAEGIPALYQARAVSNGEVVYLFGGEQIVEDGETRVANNKVFRSTDGVKWTEVEVPAAYAGTRYPSVLLVGNVVWLFDGDASVSQGYWPAPQSSDEYPGNIWNMMMK